jgi:effector-binding domain-containing protein
MGNNPLSRIFGRFMDAMVGPEFEKGLTDLKKRCESMPARESAITMNETYEVIEIVENIDETAVQIREVRTFAMPYVSIKDSCSLSEMDDRMMKSVNRLKKYIAKNDLSTTGSPMTYYHVWNPPATVVYEPTMRLNEMVEVGDGFTSGQTYSGRAVMAIHVGSYESMEESWNALDAYAESKGYEVTGSPWEEYIRHPDNEPVAENYLTHIYMPVSE